MTVLEIIGRDADGEFIARPASWDEEHGPPPRILMTESKRDAGPVAGIGDRVLARITALGADADYPYQARTIKRLARAGRPMLGIFRALPGGAGVIDPVDRKQLKEWPVPRGSTNDAKNGELVRFELTRSSRMGVQTARVIERLGNPARPADDQPDRRPRPRHPRQLSRTPCWPRLKPPRSPILKRREDLTAPPPRHHRSFDARDHDDAVWAEPDPNPTNRGGWVVIVAIADVACLRPARQRARQGSAKARQLGLFPRPRGADAAGAHLQRSLLADRGRARGPASRCA